MNDRSWIRLWYASAVIWAARAAVVSCLYAQVAPAPLSKDKVMELLRGGVATKRVATLVAQHGISFDVDDTVVAQLKDAGATDVLIDTLKHFEPRPSPATPHDNHQTPSLAGAAVANEPAAGSSDVEAKRVFQEAQTALISKKYDEAAVLFGRAARLEPGWGEPLVERAKLDAKLGRFAEAIEDCNEALQLNPNDPVALNFRGFSRYSLNRIDDAISDFNKALLLKPDYHDAYQNRGNAKWANGDKRGATNDFATARSFESIKR